MMKFLAIIGTIGLIGVGGFFYVQPDICEEPVAYHVNQLDGEFKLKQSELEQALDDAEAVWEYASGLNLFERSDSQGIAVQLIFDERQNETIREQESRTSLEGQETGIDQKSGEYDVAYQQFKAAEYSYKQRLERYNQRVSSVNRQGGASQSQYRELQAEQRALDSLRQELNEMVGRVNTLAAVIEGEVVDYNIEVASYNESYTGKRQFDQGYYSTDGEIVIYQYDSYDDLVLVLAHEFGHALGMDHVGDPMAIMNAFLTMQDTDNIMPSDSDLVELDNTCKSFSF
jgi:hypothetical protein